MPSTTLSSTGVVFPDATTQTTALRKDTANTFTALQTFSASVSVTGTVGASGDISTSGGAVSDSKGDVRRIIGNGVNNGYNTVLADAGKTVFMNAGAIGIANGIALSFWSCSIMFWKVIFLKFGLKKRIFF